MGSSASNMTERSTNASGEKRRTGYVFARERLGERRGGKNNVSHIYLFKLFEFILHFLLTAAPRKAAAAVFSPLPSAFLLLKYYGFCPTFFAFQLTANDVHISARWLRDRRPTRIVSGVVRNSATNFQSAPESEERVE